MCMGIVVVKYELCSSGVRSKKFNWSVPYQTVQSTSRLGDILDGEKFDEAV